MQGSVTYYPIDVSQTALWKKHEPGWKRRCRRSRLSQSSPTTPRGCGTKWTTGRRLVLYIGSSIGNFSPADAVEVLRGVRSQLSPGDCLLLGTDMVKDTRMLLAAYDDAAGVTARFNMNVLVRINRELGANFQSPVYFATWRAGTSSTPGSRCTWRACWRRR